MSSALPNRPTWLRAPDELALDRADKVLKPHGHALIKVFQGAGFQKRVRGEFARVKLRKLAGSRAPSAEMYLLAMDFRLV